MEKSNDAPFCSQPWSTLYVQWDGRVTRPCIRGPQNLGVLKDQDIHEFWNGESLQAVRRQVRDHQDLNKACAGCAVDHGRTIDHLNPFVDNLEGFQPHKVSNFLAAQRAHKTGATTLWNRPVVLVLDLGAKCNLRCPKCFVYNSDMQYQTGNMTMQTFEKLVPLLKTALLVVGHENGESILNKNFAKMVSVIKAHGCRFMFNTTAQHLPQDKCDLLVRSGVERIMISVDSLDTDLYAKLHKGGALQKLLDNINRLNASKRAFGSRLPELGWYTTASRSNIEELPYMIDSAKAFGFTSFFVGHLNRPEAPQWQSYFDFYAQETLIESPDDQRYFLDRVKAARVQAEAHGMEFFTTAAAYSHRP